MATAPLPDVACTSQRPLMSAEKRAVAPDSTKRAVEPEGDWIAIQVAVAASWVP